MSKVLALGLGLFAALAGCHDADKDRGTCINTLNLGTGTLPQCTVNELRYQCTHNGTDKSAEFTIEGKTEGQRRCKAAGYDHLDYVARSCEGMSSGDLRMDTGGGGAIPESMLSMAFEHNCAVEYNKPEIKK